ncbi:ferric reductase NAD binding domain-containing protein [Xylariomycetidae sp. FL2044]|nr:ferric reductase NAD binding domain-containing protein [Xylariomycetidae sp. FL2044]
MAPSTDTPATTGSHDAAANAEAAKEAMLMARQKISEEVMIDFAAALACLMGLFILSHWLRFVAVRLGLNRSRIPILAPFVALTRTLRRIFVRKLPGFTSVGHAMTVTAYVAFNVTFAFWRLDYSKSTDFAARFGWMATGNMALVMFLALKNTPLAFLTAYSYERLNVLHQIAGYTTLLFTILHASIYSHYFISEHRIEVLQEEVVTAAIVLGFALLVTCLAGLTLRRLQYELFYIIHILMFIVIVVTLGLHRPNFSHDKGLIVTVLIGASWFSDRLIRFCRLVYNSVNNEATVYPLPNGGTRIVLKKPLSRARPGKHCYVWLPKIRAFETHPFTIVSSDPMELIINTYSGFTRDLHKHASQNPGASLKVSVEGPYGTLPDPMDYDKVVLVAGGSGATFTFGLAADMLRRMSEDSKQRIEFIWAVKGHDNLSWFTRHLNDLLTHAHAPKIALRLHVTNLSSTSPALVSMVRSPSQTSEGSSTASNIEKSPIESPPRGSMLDLPLIHGRPDTETLIKDAVESVDKDQRVLVAACGPDGLLKIVRDTTANCIRVHGPAVELHCEQFGW